MPSLIEVLELLPQGRVGFELADESQGIQTVTERDPAFVVPLLIDLKQASAHRAPILVIDAPAATGKSAAASEIAARTGAALFDLANIQVASGTLKGNFVQAFGLDHGPEVLKRVTSGELAIVVDALDEAQLQARSAGFQAFLNDIVVFAREIAEASATVGLVLLARTDTADWIALTLEEEQVEFHRFAIDFFDEEQAYEFIDRKLDRGYDALARSRNHRSNRQPFIKARDALLQKIFLALGVKQDEAWADHEVRRFLGYAPVLEAATRFLLVDNHLKLLNELVAKTPSSGGRAEWALLIELVHDLLVREQQKVVTHIFPGLSAQIADGWPGGERVLFSPEEQCTRLLAQVEKLAIRPTLPLSLPTEVRAMYEQDAISALLNHPFLKGTRGYVSVVFRDYLYAFALSGRLERAEDVQAVRSRMRSRAYLPSPLFGNFLLALTEVAGTSSVSVEDTGLVVESMLEQVVHGERASAAIVGGEQGGFVLIASYNFRSEGVSRSSKVTWTVINQGRCLVLPGRVWRTSAIWYGALELAGRGDEVVVGPDTYIRAKELIVSPRDIYVVTDTDDDVELSADEFLGNESTSLTKVGAGKLRITWPAVVYPWHEFYVERPNFGDRDNEYETYVEFRRIILRFRSGRHGVLWVYKPFLDNLVVKDNRVALRVLRRLIELEIVNETGLGYELSLEMLSKAHVNYADLRANKVTPMVHALVRLLVSDTTL